MDIRRIIKKTGRMFGAFHISALGTVLGSIAAIIFLHAKVPYLELITPAMTGSYIGGSLNFVALVSIFDPPRDLVNATIVADNGVMAVYFIFLIALPGFAIILAVNFLATFILGKLFKYDIEELVLAAVVTYGGPMNGVAIAISKGWHALIVPSLLIGVWGYIIGNYTGYLMGIILDILF